MYVCRSKLNFLRSTELGQGAAFIKVNKTESAAQYAIVLSGLLKAERQNAKFR